MYQVILSRSFPSERSGFSMKVQHIESLPLSSFSVSFSCSTIFHISQPNQTFVLTATNLLEEAGYTVDYYPGEEVTIDFFKNLPALDHDLIIMRVHLATRFGDPESPLALFTSEPYIETKYFGIGSRFVTSAPGEFQNTVIIMMGCNGLSNTRMAEAFIEKHRLKCAVNALMGAYTYIYCNYNYHHSYKGL